MISKAFLKSLPISRLLSQDLPGLRETVERLLEELSGDPVGREENGDAEGSHILAVVVSVVHEEHALKGCSGLLC